MIKRLCSIAAVLGLLFFSCVTERKVIKAPLKDQGIDYLLNNTDSNTLKYEYFYGKLYVNYKSKENSSSFSVNLRIKQDSIIWLSITPALGIEAARVVITKDSVKIINRLEKTYMIKDHSYFKDKLKFNLNYSIIQSLLTNQLFLLYPQSTYKPSIDKQEYQLSTINRIALNKMIYNEMNNEADLMIHKLWIHSELFKVVKVAINEFKENRKLSIQYDDFEEIDDGQYFPFVQIVRIQSRNKAQIQYSNQNKWVTEILIDYSKIEINDKLKFSFNIPRKYERID